MKKNIILMTLVILLMTLTAFARTDAPSQWAKDTIDQVFNKGLVDQRMASAYTQDITRETFAYLGVRLYEQLTGKVATIGDVKFPDATDPYVLKAKNLGIVNGYPDGTFKPAQAITRDELAVLFVNALKASGVQVSLTQTQPFSDDAAIAAWAKESVYVARQVGIVNGVGANAYLPKGKATREQSLAMFKRSVDAYQTPQTGTDFVLSNLKGQSIALSAYRGKKVALVFYTGFTPSSVNVLNTVYKAVGTNKDWQVIAIHMTGLEASSQVADVLQSANWLGEAVLDPGLQTKAAYQIDTLPTVVTLTKEGKVDRKQTGMATTGEIEALFK